MPPKALVTTEKDLLLHAYDYDLPEELIAQDPLEQRDQSRMMVLQDHHAPIHRHIWDIMDYLRPEDCLVINKSRVIPARLHGKIPGQDSTIEVLLIRQLAEKTWRCLAKPGRKLKLGKKIVFAPDMLEAEVEGIEEDGSRILTFSYEGIWEEVLSQLGEMPLPPYIHHKLDDPDRYQTVYANRDGSVAAPTAGLHFTQDLLAAIQAKGAAIAGVYLHVGIGTFRPVKEDHILDHQMHSEVYESAQKPQT